MSVFGQLTIKSLVESRDLQDEIASFAFYDKITAEQMAKTRRIKNTMVSDMNRKLKYCLAPGPYWGLTYYNVPKKYIAMGGQIHSRCGNYYALHSGDIIPRCVRCNCPGMVQEHDDEDV